MKIFLSAVLLVNCFWGLFHNSKVEPRKGLTPHTDTSTIILNRLTAADRINYPLTVRLGKYCSDSCGNVSFLLYATLENNSNDTLQYLDWNCEHFIWRTNNINVTAIEPTTFCDGCLHNFLDVFRVPPHKSTSFVLRAGYRQGAQMFKLGMTLQRVMKDQDWTDNIEHSSAMRDILQSQTVNIVWSNEISIR